MPQILDNSPLTPEEEKIKEVMLKEVFPEYSHQNFAEQLKLQGFGISDLAREYAESLQGAKPEVKLAAIERILKLVGVDANIDIQKKGLESQPTINIHLSGEGSQNLLQFIAPKRERVIQKIAETA